ncbi:MAG: HAMP domain-containing sensor histidine kinase [Nitrososphaeraceae archaeon]
MNSSSSSSENKTEIWYGAENIINRSLEVLYSIENQFDLCITEDGLNPILSEERIKKAYYDLKARGVTIRIIIEVTKSNLKDCRVLSEIAQLRHLSEMSGNFVIADRKNYAAAADLNVSHPQITELITSTVPAFVKQQQHFFEMLWSKSVPIEQRISEIEAGVVPDVLEVIKEPSEIISHSHRLVKAAKDEILIIFHTSNALLRQERAGGIDILIENVIRYKTRVRILVPIEDKITDTIQRLEMIKGIQVRNIGPTMQTRMAILVVDRTYSLVVELKDDSKDNPEEAIGLGTYSNSKSTVLSYVSIFDTLWKQSELREELIIHNKAQQEFINIAAHELRTPIQPILGLSDVLLQSDILLDNSNSKSKIDIKNNETTIREMIQIIARNAKRLQRLTEDILDITKIESKTLKLKKQNFILSKIIEEIVDDYSAEIRDSNRNLILTFLSLEELESTPITADQNRLKQVINNLIDNAIKFTRDGKITISAEIDTKHNQVIVKVKDTGTGIDSDILPKLFTKFVTKSDKGTGLGLYICKGIIEAHHGKIWAENNYDGNGNGTTLSFCLPLIQS